MNDSQNSQPLRASSAPRRMRILFALLALTVLLGAGALYARRSGLANRLDAHYERWKREREIERTQDKDFSGQNLKGEAFADSQFGASKMHKADMRGAQLSSATFIEADLREAMLDAANLKNANLLAADLSNASLRNAQLDEAWLTDSILRGADLAGASLTGARLPGADLSTARGLTQAQLASACGDEATKLPAGLHVPACE